MFGGSPWSRKCTYHCGRCRVGATAQPWGHSTWSHIHTQRCKSRVQATCLVAQLSTIPPCHQVRPAPSPWPNDSESSQACSRLEASSDAPPEAFGRGQSRSRRWWGSHGPPYCSKGMCWAAQVGGCGTAKLPQGPFDDGRMRGTMEREAPQAMGLVDGWSGHAAGCK
jgi:hypothetical protein